MLAAMEWKKQTLAIGLTVAGLLAFVAVPARAATAQGACSARSRNGTGWTQWHTSGSNNVVSGFDYKVTGSKTNGKSNVRIEHYHNRSLQPDDLLYVDDSPDNVGHNVQYRHTPSRPIVLNIEKSQHTDYIFVFDVTGPDPKCKARTNDFD